MKDPKLLETLKVYKGRDDVPEDFDSFWNQALAKMTELPEYKLEERDFNIPNVVCYELTFKGTGLFKNDPSKNGSKSSCYFPFSWLYGTLLGLG